jgi:hypothetical protein
MAKDEQVPDDLVMRCNNRGSEETPRGDFLDLLRALAYKGFPIFARDLHQVVDDIFRASYYAVRAEYPNAFLIFLDDISIRGIGWIIDGDEFGIGESMLYTAGTKYIRGCSKNDGVTRISVYKSVTPRLSSKLDEKELHDRWEYLQRTIPSVADGFGERFDIVEWYRMITYGERF